MVQSSERKRPTGRRAGDSGTREAILDAALTLLATRGYEGTSMRAIAAEAGVDPALIRHFFGDKERLFTTVVADRTEIPARIAAVIGAQGAQGARALVDAYLHMWEDEHTGPILLALVRSVMTSDVAMQMVRDMFISAATARSDASPERIGRVALAGSHLLGVAVARHIVRVPPIVAMSHQELVDQITPAFESYLA